jgi:hypothetical protein
MSKASVSEINWAAVTSQFRVDLDQSARESNALVRKRRVRDAPSLLRLCLMYGFCSYSLRETAACATAAGVADVCDVSLLERLLHCEIWLKQLLTDLLDQRAEALLKDPLPRKRVCLIDATVITIPGSTGVDWRVHLSLDLARECIEHVEITDSHGGESLSRFANGGNRIEVGDRAYGFRSGLATAVAAGNDVIVRLNWQNLPLMNADGEPVRPLDLSRGMLPGQIRDIAVLTQPTKDTPPIAGRFIAIRKSEEDTNRAIKRAKKERKNGRAPSAQTIEACGYIFLLTTLSEADFSAEEVAAIYRLRWQIEIAFKRMKQVLKLGDLQARSPQLCRVALLAKLIGILLSEGFAEPWRAFPP